MGWIKDGIRFTRVARHVRKAGFNGELVLIQKEILDNMYQDNRSLMDSYQLAYDCIETMVEGKSACRYCMQKNDCHDKKKGNLRGCEHWCLMWPEEEKDEQTAAEEDRAAEQENQEAELPGPDARGEAGEAVSERDNG